MVRKLHLTADAALAQVQRELPFSLVNPENADAVRKRFLRRPYEPVFTYADLPDAHTILQRLKRIRCGITKPGRLLRREREELRKKTFMTAAIGHDAFPKTCEAVYGKPAKPLVREAEQLLALPPTPKDTHITYMDVRKLLLHTFTLLGFRYTVKREPLVSSAYLSPAKRVLALRAKERFGRRYAYRLAVHEIATHALRAENGRTQRLGIFSRGTPGYLTTEEGLAAFNEERAGVMTTSIMRTYAGRVIATDVARNAGFLETYKHLRQHFTTREAFTLTLRAKRGLTDASQPGACTKDHVYLKGYLEVKRYAASGKPLTPLFAGKVGLEDLREWRRRLRNAPYTPEPVLQWVRATAHDERY